MLKFQENKLKIVQQNFFEIKIIFIKKDFWSQLSLHDYNMGSQRSKIGGN